jgi:uncharacterized protein involved in exopolysaccharide biosynthesis
MAREKKSKLELGKQEATLRDFLNVVFRRKALILSIVLITTALVYTLNTMQPQLYESNSRVLIRRGEIQGVFDGIRYLSWEEEISSQIEVVLSEAVYALAREFFNDSTAAYGVSDHARFNPGSVRASAIGESNVLALRYSGYDPAECKLGCAAITWAYARYYKQKKAPPELTDYFAQEMQDINTELAHWRQKKNDFLNKEKFFGMDKEGGFLLSKLGNIELQLNELNTDVTAQRAQVENLRALSTLSSQELESKLAMSIPPSILQSGIVINIKQGLQNLRTKEEDLKNKYTDKHPEVIALNEQIRDLQTSLKQEVVNIYIIEQANLKDLVTKQASLQDQMNKTQAAINKIPDKETELNKIDHQIALLEGKYSDLLEKMDQSQIKLASSPDWEVIILSSASNAYAKKTKDYVRMAVGPLLSLVVAMGLAFFFESIDHSLNNAAEVEEYLDAGVLATISEMRSGK